MLYSAIDIENSEFRFSSNSACIGSHNIICFARANMVAGVSIFECKLSSVPWFSVIDCLTKAVFNPYYYCYKVVGLFFL